MKPLMFTAEVNEGVLLCACKQTRSGPYCDGSHNNLDDTYSEADYEEIAQMAEAILVPRDNGAVGKALLDGGAYVLTRDLSLAEKHGTLSVQSLISSADGAKHISFLSFDVDAGVSPWQNRPVSDTVLFCTKGTGTVNVEGRQFEVGPDIGVYVKAGESFRFETEVSLMVYAAICPEAKIVSWPEEQAGTFDAALPKRCVGFDPVKAQIMADRFYQVLVDSDIGSQEVTQFIGEVPRSRAAMHRHLYEEVIVILSGEGMMWTGGLRAPVKPGDIIFLPRRQGHSLECLSESGMRLMGVFYPAGSPAINY